MASRSSAEQEVSPTLEGRQQHLESILREMESVAIGFSGGADSTLLLGVAVQVLGNNALALTAVSPSFPERDRLAAIELARRMGARHLLVDSHEFDDPGYVAN